MKKAFIILCTFLLTLVFSCIISTENTINAETIEQDNFTVICESKTLNSFNGVKFDIYTVEPEYDEIGNLVQYNHSHMLETTMNEQNLFSFIKPSDRVLIRPKLNTLPSGYGINEKSLITKEEMDKVTFKIDEVADAIVKVINSEVNVLLYSETGSIVYAEYTIDITNNPKKPGGYIGHVFVGDKELEREVIVSGEGINIIETTQYQNTELNANDFDTIPEYDNESRIKVECDDMTQEHSQDLINLVQNQAKDIENYFFSSNGLNLALPNYSTDNDYLIKLITKTDKENSIINGETDNQGNGKSYIIIYCPNIFSKFNSSTMNELYICLAHEYFHASIMKHIWLKYGKTHFSMESDCIEEAMACFMGFEYLVNCSKYDSSNNYCLKNLMVHYQYYILNCHQNHFEPFNGVSFSEYKNYAYSLMFFMGYIYKEYGINSFIDMIENAINSNEDVLTTLNKLINGAKYPKSFSTIFREFSKDFFNIDKMKILNGEGKNKYEMPKGVNLNIYYGHTQIQHFSFNYTLPGFSTKHIFASHPYCEDYEVYTTIDINDKNGRNKVDLSYVTKDSDEKWSTVDINYIDDLVTIPWSFDSVSSVCSAVIITNYGTKPVVVDASTSVTHIAKVEENEPINLVQFHEKFASETEKNFYVKFIPQKSVFHSLSLKVDGDLSHRFSVRLLDNNYEQVYKYDTSDEPISFNITTSLDMIVDLKKDQVYYIEVTINRTTDPWAQKAMLTISSANDLIKLNNLPTFTYEGITGNKKEKVLEINSFDITMYNIKFEYTGNDNIEFKYGFASYNSNERKLWMSSIINHNNITLEHDSTFIEQNNPCILLTGLKSDIQYRITFTRLVDKNVSLFTDPNSNVAVGSEVKFNHGSYYGTTITSGYTRCIYISKDQIYSSSRLDYMWASSNPDVAVVSKYGTVTTKAVTEPTTVYISCTYNHNYKYVGYIQLTILPDTMLSRVIEITTDKRNGELPAGTEVTELGGQPEARVLHEGYTRFITFVKNNPTESYQDYIWTSSNPDVASVSIYGTITAISAGTTTITGVYKNNPNFVAEMEIRVYRSFEMTYD